MTVVDPLGQDCGGIEVDPIVASLALTGIVKNAPHPNEARLLLDFLLSKVPTLKTEAGGYTPIYLTQDLVAQNFDHWKKLYEDLFQ